MGKIQNIRNIQKSKKSKKSKSKKNNKLIRTKKPSYRQKAGSCSKNPICALLNWLSESKKNNNAPKMSNKEPNKPKQVELKITAVNNKGKSISSEGEITLRLNIPPSVSNEQVQDKVKNLLNKKSGSEGLTVAVQSSSKTGGK